MRPSDLLCGAIVLFVIAACARSQMSPASLDTANEDCARCRMRVSERKFAAQIVAPGEEPRFFDDIGCFVDEIREKPQPGGALAYVADHRTGDWVRAANAVYARVPALETPMNSHVIAHASAESRRQDPAARGGEPLTVAALFGTARVPDGAAK